jgi:aldehyde:ferredoxin oxidoreductase
MSKLEMRLANINLDEEIIGNEIISEENTRKYLGGNGLAIKLFWERMRPGVDPFSPENLLYLGAGPLVGTGIQGSDRVCLATKSPLTGLFFDSTMGGRFASSLKQAGFDALSIIGKAKSASYLLVSNGNIEIRDAGELIGKSPEKYSD